MDTQATGNYYTINHLALASGLTDRTIRTYISTGILQGEKINGLWHFTPEQVDAFFNHPAVRPSILAKKNALIYDFLAMDKSKEETCIILDFPEGNQKETMEFFCYEINNGNFTNIHFSFDNYKKSSRVILKGYTQDVLQLVNKFYSLGK